MAYDVEPDALKEKGMRVLSPDDGLKPEDDAFEMAYDGLKPVDDAFEMAYDGLKPADDAFEMAYDGLKPADDAFETAYDGLKPQQYDDHSTPHPSELKALLIHSAPALEIHSAPHPIELKALLIHSAPALEIHSAPHPIELKALLIHSAPALEIHSAPHPIELKALLIHSAPALEIHSAPHPIELKALLIHSAPYPSELKAKLSDDAEINKVRNKKCNGNVERASFWRCRALLDECTGKPPVPVTNEAVNEVRTALMREWNVMQWLANPYLNAVRTEDTIQNCRWGETTGYGRSPRVIRRRLTDWRGPFGPPQSTACGARQTSSSALRLAPLLAPSSHAPFCEVRKLQMYSSLLPKPQIASGEVEKRRANVGNLLHAHRTVEDELKNLERRNRWD
ncbi:hypothetical protein niasHT_023429 [Heterodera trifolii]|uniref:Uncharacterized protein n=1 Tax=Heterodera trifolii TaxID=157864 RepID=A0ABD2K4T9_9BILA